MADDTGRISLTLTPEQREQIKAATGRNAEQLELDVTELEERIAPSRLFHKDF